MAVTVVLAGVAGRASAQDRLAQESRDPITGSVAKVYRTSHGPRIDLVATGLLVRKEVVEGRVKTTITSGRNSLVIEAGPQFMSVATAGQRVVATAADPAPLEKATRLVANSPLAARAAALIGKLGFGDRSPLQPLLLTTRAFLLAARNDASGARELSNWMGKARSAARIVPVSLTQRPRANAGRHMATPSSTRTPSMSTACSTSGGTTSSVKKDAP
jgi:hypothetical protein